MSRNILIVSAHPDDMEIGMGGTVAKLVAERAEITSLVVTDGAVFADPMEAAPAGNYAEVFLRVELGE